MHYREYAASSPLEQVLECLWTLEGHLRDLGGEPQPVLPDGRAEIVLHFGDRFDRLRGGRPEAQPSIIFAGQLTEQLVLAPTGRIAVLGIRFRPHGAVALLGQPLHDLTGVVTGLDSIDGRLFRILRRVLDSATSLGDAARGAQQALATVANLSRVDPRVRHATGMIERRRGQGAIDDVVRETCTTRRHLERLFKDQVGMSPKRLSRIARFQHALRLLERADTAAPGTATAFECGYADQAHFIRDFKDLAGCPPGEHLVRKTALTGFFIAGRP